MIEKKKIEATVNDWMSDPSVFLVEVRIDKENNIRVFMDADKGFSIDQCVELTRYIESVFDRDVEDYQLTVSSYGISQPFVTERQYRKYIGRKVEVEPVVGKPFSGTLLGFDGSSVRVERKLSNKEIKEGKSPEITLEINAIRAIRPSISFN